MTVVAVLALTLAGVLAGVCGVLIVALRRVRARADELAVRVAELPADVPLAPDLEAALSSGKRRVLVIEILNPIELALSRNRAAGVLAAMAPSRLRKIVLEQTAKEMAAEFENEGVRAEVKIHAAA